MPERCECGGCVEATGESDRVIVDDIPPVHVERTLHVTPIGRCVRCKKRVVTRLPGATSGGRRVAKVVIGPNAQALMTSLRFEGNMTMPAICATMGTWLGLSITRGGLAQILQRIARRAAPSYEEIVAHVRNASLVGVDETGLRQDGVSGWAWLVRTATASLFRIELSRAAWVADQMLGADFKGIVCSDFYSVYTRRDDWKHAYCGAHMIREAKKIAEVSPSPRTEKFCKDVRDFYRDAKRGRNRRTRKARHALRVRLGKLIANRDLSLNPDVARLQRRLHTHFHGILTFVDRPEVPADNNATERDLRAFACFRKATGGTRSPRGSKTAAGMMSITQTLRKNGLPLRQYVIGLYDTHLLGRAPPSVFAKR